MTRTPLALAALASAAVPGLDPATVEGVVPAPGHQFQVAFIEDSQHRRWVARAPLTAAAGAQMDLTVALLGLLSRRVPFSVPTPKGFAPLKEGGRAAVYPFMVGRPLDFAHLPAGPGLAAELGRSIAALHNVDRRLFEEAGMPTYDAETYRTRRLADLDRAAATGRVPTGLLARWERLLEDVGLWRFAPTPTHGDLTGDEVLAVFEDEDDVTSGRIRALTGWEDAKVADPADDFAALVSQASREAFDSVLEAYAHARVDRPDANLERRARLAGELQTVSALLVATGGGDRAAVDRVAATLRELDERTRGDQSDLGDPLAAVASGSVAAGSVAVGYVAVGSVAVGSVAVGSVAVGSVAAGSVAAGSDIEAPGGDGSGVEGTGVEGTGVEGTGVEATVPESGMEPTVAMPIPADGQPSLVESPGRQTRAVPPPG